MLRALLAVVLATASLCAFATTEQPRSEVVRRLLENMKTPPMLKGEFEQTKTLKGFKNPLVSKGEFLIARGQGVWWHTRQPFESVLVVTKTRLFTRNADGSAGNLMDAQAEPGLKQVNELIFSLLAADADALAGKFIVSSEPAAAPGWSMRLVPRDPAIAKFLVGATLAGDHDVQAVRIEEASGDVTQIRFSHQVPSAALTADEAARFQ